MANKVFNIGLGAVIEKARDGAALGILLLKAAEADAALVDHANIQALLAAGGNTEADFTNYARQTLAGVAVNVDNVGDEATVDADDILYTSAGGTTDNSVVKAIVFEAIGGNVNDDANNPPLLSFDAVFTTDGNNVTLQVNAGGLMGAVSA